MGNTTEKILVLGAGKMVEGILTGLGKKLDLSHIFIYSPSGTTAKNLANKLGAKHIQDPGAIKPDLVLVGCKPQQIQDLKKIIGDQFKNVPAISILAALDEQTQRDILGFSLLIRVMPNLAVAYNCGVSLISTNSAPSLLKRVEDLFIILGHVEIVSETELEDLTLLTGSTPAFFYEFARYLANSFDSLDGNKRESLIRKSLIGAAETLKSSPLPLEELIQNVTSKGGVTIAVLEELRRQKLDSIVKDGIRSGHSRGKDLRSSILQS